MIIGIGCDIVNLARIQKAMDKEGFDRILTEREHALYAVLQGMRKVEWLAGRFAAKEAIFKAIHKQIPCTIYDIEILSDEVGAPYCTLEQVDVQISIAHEKEYAIAYAIGLSKE